MNHADKRNDTNLIFGWAHKYTTHTHTSKELWTLTDSVNMLFKYLF